MTTLIHLLTRTTNEPLGGTRYRALCGASGLTKRDYSPTFTAKRVEGVVQVVTCPLCLAKVRKTERMKV